MFQQDKCIFDILNRAGMSSCKPADTLISTSKVIVVPDCFFFFYPTQFHQIIDALQCLTFMRSDICFVVNKVCQLMHASNNAHRVVVKHIMCYLRGTFSFGLHITCSSSFDLHGFMDVD